jgi:CHASE3 domain sensor protein
VNGKIKYMIVFLTLILLGIGLYLYLQEKESESADKKREAAISFEEKLLAISADVKENIS